MPNIHSKYNFLEPQNIGQCPTHIQVCTLDAAWGSVAGWLSLQSLGLFNLWKLTIYIKFPSTYSTEIDKGKEHPTTYPWNYLLPYLRKITVRILSTSWWTRTCSCWHVISDLSKHGHLRSPRCKYIPQILQKQEPHCDWCTENCILTNMHTICRICKLENIATFPSLANWITHALHTRRPMHVAAGVYEAVPRAWIYLCGKVSLQRLNGEA